MKILGFTHFFILCLFTTACSSAFKVTSDPIDAEVAVLIGEKKERKVIGKTPLEIPTAELDKHIGDALKPGQFFTLQVSKTGFETQSFNLPSTNFGTTVTQIDAKLKAGETQNNLATAQELVKQLFLAQRFALSKQFERSLIELDRILLQYPNFARALSMKASVYYAQAKYDESLKYYEEALKADPQMEETVRLAAKVRELMSAGRKPAQK